MAKRKRDVPVLFWVSAEELELIHQKMQQYGTENLSAYLRKMALDGYVVKLDLPELKELVSLMRRSSNNLNQLTRKVHETGRIYDADLEDISQRQEQLWEGRSSIFRILFRYAWNSSLSLCFGSASSIGISAFTRPGLGSITSTLVPI